MVIDDTSSKREAAMTGLIRVLARAIARRHLAAHAARSQAQPKLLTTESQVPTNIAAAGRQAIRQ